MTQAFPDYTPAAIVSLLLIDIIDKRWPGTFGEDEHRTTMWLQSHAAFINTCTPPAHSLLGTAAKRFATRF